MDEIKLTNTQAQLFSFWASEVQAINNQFLGAINMLYREIQKNMINGFKEELKVPDGFLFDPRSNSFKPKPAEEKGKENGNDKTGPN